LPASLRICARPCAILEARGKRDLEAASRRYAAALACGQARFGARSVEPLGLMHGGRRALIFMAADPHAARCAGLSGGARVAHLVEMNHSRKFWRVVAGICPSGSAPRGWLNAHGAALHRYGEG